MSGGRSRVTATSSGVAVAVFPALSMARASRCSTVRSLGTVTVNMYGGNVAVPTSTPFAVSVTPATPTLSSAVTLTGILLAPNTVPDGGRICTVGGTVSGMTLSVTVFETDVLPAKSVARAVSAIAGEALVTMTLKLYGATLDVRITRPLLESSTAATATSSVAETLTGSCAPAKTDAPFDGVVMETDGAIVPLSSLKMYCVTNSVQVAPLVPGRAMPTVL